MSEIPSVVEEFKDEIERLKKIPPLANTVLPELKADEIFFCTYCGNDEVKPEHYQLDYIAIQDRYGNDVYKKSMMDYRSGCCGEDFIILNTSTNEEVPWPE